MEYNTVAHMEYNTTRNHLIMREYGRHIQKMIEYLLTIEDPEQRQKNTQVVIELMGFLNLHLKNVEDFRHKLWDHLFLISDFKLEVDSPYPIPTRETLKAKRAVLGYPKQYAKFLHLSKNIVVVIGIALIEETPEEITVADRAEETIVVDRVAADAAAITGTITTVILKRDTEVRLIKLRS